VVPSCASAHRGRTGAPARRMLIVLPARATATRKAFARGAQPSVRRGAMPWWAPAIAAVQSLCVSVLSKQPCESASVCVGPNVPPAVCCVALRAYAQPTLVWLPITSVICQIHRACTGAASRMTATKYASARAAGLVRPAIDVRGQDGQCLAYSWVE
jgi:hypothetical protein